MSMSSKTVNIESLRIASQLFSKATILNIVKKNDLSHFEYYSSLIYNSDGSKNKEKIKKIYNLLSKKYRCEYFYKNNLLNTLIKKYSLKDSVVLNEVNIGTSIADVMFINGVCKIYEIKTELDSISKLRKQINDYSKVSELVYVVCSDSLLERILKDYENSNIGILLLEDNNSFKEIQPPKVYKNNFCFDTIFKLMRKSEYVSVYEKYFSILPEMPNTKVFSFCYERLKDIDIISFQYDVMSLLKQRNIVYNKKITSKNIPFEIKYICNSIQLKDKEIDRLSEFLNC